MLKLDDMHVQDLRNSREIIGELSPVVIDSDGEILVGSHRKKAGWLKTQYIDTETLAKKWCVPRQVAKEMVRVNSNVQRTVKVEETEASLLKMAKAFEDQGIPREKIASEVAKRVPFTSRWVRQLLPSKYKNKQLRVNGELVPRLDLEKLSRVEASKKLSRFLKDKVPTIEDQEFEKHAREIMENPGLPFPDCKCSNCSHYKECHPW